MEPTSEHSSQAEDLLRQAEAAYRKGESERAEELCRQVLAICQNAGLEQESAALREGDHLIQDAVPFVDGVSGLTMRQVAARAESRLGVLAAGRKDWGAARQHLEAAIGLDPKYAPAVANLGNIEREEGHLEKAIERYRQALDLDPELAMAYHNLGVVYRQQGDYQRAIPLLKKAARMAAQQQPGHREARTGNRLTAWILVIVVLALIWAIMRPR